MVSVEALRDYNLIYLATPYTKYKKGIHHAFSDASSLAARLVKEGVNVYSPIAHTHPIALYGNIDPKDGKFWIKFDTTMMNLSDILVVAKMEGWEKSGGVQHEIKHFRKYKKPVCYLEPGTLQLTIKETK